MSNILGLRGLSTPTVSQFIAAYGNDMVNIATGQGYGLALDPSRNVEMETFLSSLFFQNGVNRPLSFDGIEWTTKHLARPPLGKYLRVWRSRQRMYVAYVNIMDVAYPSRIMYCDLPNNNTIQWGYEYGFNLQTTTGSATVMSANAGFQTYNIKRGDPFFILTGADQGEYKVISVDADQQVTLDTPLKATAAGIQYWAGGNWFDIGPDDGDFITWMEVNNDTLIVFKRDTLYRVPQSDGSSLVQIRGAYGTTSGRSVANLHEITIYWYSGVGVSTGFYAYNGLYMQKISSPIDNHIAGINPVNYQNIVGWREGELYRAYVGDINNFAKGIIVPGAICTWDYFTKTWSIDPASDVPTVSTEFRQVSTKSTYFGTTDSLVMATPLGNTANGIDMPFVANINTLYPIGSGGVCEFLRAQIISTNMEGVQVQYRLHFKPFITDKNYIDLGELSAAKTELVFRPDPAFCKASGIEFRFQALDGQPAEGNITKITLFYRPSTTVIQ